MKFMRLILILMVVLSGILFLHAGTDEAAMIPYRPVVVVGKASWYSEHDAGINERTANNEVFDDRELTCAMWDIPFNSKIKVTNRDNGKSIIVRVNDRGPHRRFVTRGRVIDLTKGAFRQIGDPKRGLINVELEIL